MWWCVAGTDAKTNKAGIQAVEAVLDEARRIARTLPADRKAVIEGLCDELESLKRELAMLQSSGQVGSNWKEPFWMLIGMAMLFLNDLFQ